MSPSVTCIIPVWNGEATIDRAIESALQSGCQRVLIYDDGSTDKTLDRLEQHTQDRFRISVYSDLKGIRRGVNYARNFLVGEAYDSLIIPLDADDTLCDIRPLVEAWQPDTWVYGDYYQQEGHHISRISGAPYGALPRKEITGISFLFHKRDWRKVNGYDPDFAYCEDWAFQCALTHAGVKPVYVETVVYERTLNPKGNERTSLAGEYWNFYHQMARRKYPSLFQVNR
jgi:Glycosyltransferases involved in cell wall biogenesis